MKLKIQCLEYLKELDILLETARKDIDSAPEGSLNTSRKGNSIQYYWNKHDDKARQYIPKAEIKLAHKLAQKEYAIKMETNIKEIKSEIIKLLHVLDRTDFDKIYNQMIAPKKRILNPYILLEDDFIAAWERKNINHKNNVKMGKYIIFDDYNNGIITEKGENVRSKSEKIIADKLYNMNIPYLYEVPLLLNGYGYIRPDFLVLNRRTRKEYYWEHFGMMDDENYCQSTIKKMESYMKNNMFIGKQILTTFETLKYPLNLRMMEKIIKEYLI